MRTIINNLSLAACFALILTVLTGVTSPLYAHDLYYKQHNLVSDGFVTADKVDPQLINPWGIAFNPNAVVWISDNGTGVSTLYNGLGEKQSLVVTIPPSSGSAPTGTVYNSSNDFVVSSGSISGPSRFIFATEDGTISGWASSVNPTNAIIAVDNSASGSIYKGLALAANGIGHFLYATDFHNGKIDVFDKNFKPTTLSGSFVDPHIPAGYAPFGIQNLNGDIYVTYAKQDADKKDDVKCPGCGFVDVFDPNGYLIKRIASRGPLNAPWGLALAPANFGLYSNRLLVGNFGDGTINAYGAATGIFLGQLKQPNRKVLKIDGLWGLSFGNGILNQPTDTLFFTAGPGDEKHGIYGTLEPAAGNGLPGWLFDFDAMMGNE
jgi:uncharacterized protein (TIGR03118 family)